MESFHSNHIHTGDGKLPPVWMCVDGKEAANQLQKAPNTHIH